MDGLAFAEVMKSLETGFTYHYFLQATVNLFSYAKGFFGRSYRGVQVKLNPQTMKPVDLNKPDWATFNTKLVDKDVFAVVEFMLVIKKEAPSN